MRNNGDTHVCTGLSVHCAISILIKEWLGEKIVWRWLKACLNKPISAHIGDKAVQIGLVYNNVIVLEGR